jgi:hypothetical protein
MKILSSLGFLVIIILSTYIGYKWQSLSIGKLDKDNKGSEFIFRLIALVLAFCGFWILTRIFPFYLILLLVVALLLAFATHLLIGAIAGFTLQEKRKKVVVLFLMRSFERGFKEGLEGNKLASYFFIFLPYLPLLGLVVSVIGSLWSFWRYPIGDPQARVLIAFFQFTLFFLTSMIYNLIIFWPVVSSEFVDDDLRNFYLSGGFSMVLYSTIFLLFPLWIFKQDFNQLFGSLPPFWLLLSIPLLLFLIGYVFPFFIGLYLYRHQARNLLEWQREWLNQVLQLVQLPKGETRSKGLEEKFSELENERNKRLSENTLFKFYLYIATGKIEGENNPLNSLQRRAVSPLYGSAADSSDVSTALITKKSDEDQNEIGAAMRLQEMKELFSHPVYDKMVDAIWENRTSLPKWDIRFGHVYKLNNLYQLTLDGKSANIKDTIKLALEDTEKRLADLSSKSNILSASTISVLSAVIVWLFKIFEQQIINTISKLF